MARTCIERFQSPCHLCSIGIFRLEKFREHGYILTDILGESPVAHHSFEEGLPDMTVGVDEAWDNDFIGSVDNVDLPTRQDYVGFDLGDAISHD